MTNRYFKVSQRGFANEVTYFCVPTENAADVERYFENYENMHPDARTGWTAEKRAHQPGVAIDWADRAYVGF